VRIAYLGPAGTFTEDALREALPQNEYEPLLTPTIRDAIVAVESGEAERALVPFENSIEGAVRMTLDALAMEAKTVTIVGEFDYTVHAYLIARSRISRAEIVEVLSHPQPLAQCAGFLRRELPKARERGVSSSAEAVRQVSEAGGRLAAIGSRAAAEFYGCVVLEEKIEDEANNVTRFVWIAPAGTEADSGSDWKTSLVFSELGEDHPGALVEALREFSDRDVNLTRIESRPLRLGLGRYMFFCDLEGALSETDVAAAIEGLRGKAESVRILGSYPTA
jgi:prephenate dehydratase